ncbi:MAG: hypothetical protein U1E61_07385 [Bradyrhizobium sp.]
MPSASSARPARERAGFASNSLNVAAIDGYRVLEARVTAHGHATPYQPILELARDYLGIQPNMQPEEARERVASVVSAFTMDDETLSLLLDFLGLVDPAQSATQPDPAMRKKRLVELLRLFVRSGQQVRPASSCHRRPPLDRRGEREFIEEVADAIIGTKTMLLFNFRHGYSAPWMQRSRYRQISLSPLRPADTEGLLVELLGSIPRWHWFRAISPGGPKATRSFSRSWCEAWWSAETSRARVATIAWQAASKSPCRRRSGRCWRPGSTISTNRPAGCCNMRP